MENLSKYLIGLYLVCLEATQHYSSLIPGAKMLLLHVPPKECIPSEGVLPLLQKRVKDRHPDYLIQEQKNLISVGILTIGD